MKEVVQFVGLTRRPTGPQLGADGRQRRPGLAERAESKAGRVDPLGPPVVLVGSAHHESALLKVVDQPYRHGHRGPELAGELAHRRMVVGRSAQGLIIGPTQPDGPQPLR